MTTYLWWSRTLHFSTVEADYVALAVSVAVGLLGVLVLPISRRWRAAIAIPYVAISSIGLGLWSIGYVCGQFPGCFAPAGN